MQSVDRFKRAEESWPSLTKGFVCRLPFTNANGQIGTIVFGSRLTGSDRNSRDASPVLVLQYV